MDNSGNERSALGDSFDRIMRALTGLPDVVKTKASTVRCQSKVLERTQTFIVQTFRQSEEGDTIFLEYVGSEGSIRIALPPVVSEVIARQYDALTGKSRSKAAKARADENKALGILPGFMREKKPKVKVKAKAG